MKIIYAGTPDFAVPALQALIDSSYDVVAVYTQPDRPAGRGKKLLASPVKQLALAHDIPVEQPLSFKEPAALETLKNYQADVMIVAAYGLILPTAVLESFPFGCINIHGSLLPRWRGAAPIQRAIIANDKETGIGIMQMEKGLDTGPVFAEAKCPIHTDDTGQSLHDRLADLGAKTLIESLPGIFDKSLTAKPQDDSLANYAHKLTKQEACTDWQEPAALIERKIRAFNPWPIAYFNYQNQPIRVWEASVITEKNSVSPGTIVSFDKQGLVIACGENQLRLESLQFPGGKRLKAADVFNGKKEFFIIGESL